MYRTIAFHALKNALADMYSLDARRSPSRNG
jgi:hypothetical protein